MQLNIPNILTILRIIVIPVLVIIFYLPETFLSKSKANMLATFMFIFAAITDWADGYLARKLNQTSKWGEFLDPVADKLLVAVALVMLCELNRAPAYLVAIIISREILISALREWMAKIGGSKSVAVSFLGKIKTAVQMVSIPLLLWQDDFLFFNAQQVGLWCLYAASILTIWSMFYYFKKSYEEIKLRNLA